MKRRSHAILALAATLALAACDNKSAETAEQEVQQVERNNEGRVWGALLEEIREAPDDAAKAVALEKFLADHPDHPDVPEAKRRLEGIRMKVSQEEIAKKAWEGDLQALTAIFVLTQGEGLQNEGETALEESLTLPGAKGPVEYDQRLLVAPVRLRRTFKYMLSSVHPEPLERGCDDPCFNAAVNGLLTPAIGAPLFVEPGKVDENALGALVEKAYIAPDTELLRFPAQRTYEIFRPTVRAFAKTRAAVKEADVAAAAKRLNSLGEPKEIRDFYASWTADNKIAEKVGMGEKAARNFTSFWIRREADGSAKVLDGLIERLARDYDPELAAGEPAAEEAEPPQN